MFGTVPFINHSRNWVTIHWTQPWCGLQCAVSHGTNVTVSEWSSFSRCSFGDAFNFCDYISGFFVYVRSTHNNNIWFLVQS